MKIDTAPLAGVTRTGNPLPADVAVTPARPPRSEAGVTEEPFDRLLHAAIGRSFGGFTPMGLAEAWVDWALHLAVSPARAREISVAALDEAGRLAEHAAATIAGAAAPTCGRALPQDKRFRNDLWRSWPFAVYAEGLLAAERLVDEATSHIHGATEHHLAMLNFVGRQALDLAAPSNFIATNPEVLDATMREHGMNLFRGASFALEDFTRQVGKRRPVGADAFRPGETVALTPGRVVHKTRLAEIIQYEPATPSVHKEPVVIVPAWIMRYYILDLRQQNSLIGHLVAAGFTVFVISWKNPGVEDRDLGLDDYRLEGVMPAITAALAATGAARAHAVGYCIGGTLLGLTAAAMARDADNRLASLTFLAAQVDFREAGELGLFVDESQLAILDDMMSERGLLEAARMAGTFNLLRSNDLIWSKLIRNYMLGQREPMTDIAAWSTDATRMPARMHSEYLRAFYLNNDLAEGRYEVGGQPIALRDIRLPVFAVGTEWDHVAPWRSVYKLHLLLDSDITFALTNGGHNQGIVAPPTRTDRHFRILTTREHDKRLDPERWVENAALCDGSWWPAWFEWLSRHSSGRVDAEERVLREAKNDLGAAPGTYVFG